METAAQPARRMGIVGTGLMGNEIAFVAAAADMDLAVRLGAGWEAGQLEAGLR